MGKILVAFVAVLLMASPAMAESPGKITVTGQGRVEMVPDMATINLGVTTQARTSAEAMAMNTKALGQVLAEIRDAGIVERDIQTNGLSLSPVWNRNSSSDGGASNIVGFSVSNQVTIRIRALDVVGSILDVVVNNGANQFHGLVFGVQEPGPAEDEARQRAVQDAIRKAAQLADVAGVDLGAILEMNENGSSGARPGMARAAMMSDAVPVAAGEVSIGASVTMVYEIKE
jgi:uncharacterized protein YggE